MRIKHLDRLMIIMNSLLALFVLISLTKKDLVFLSGWASDVVGPMIVYFAFLSIWSMAKGKWAPRLLCFFAGIGVTYLVEFLQYIKFQIYEFPLGTYDPFDFIYYTTGALLAVLIDTLLIRRR